ncbi:uncharacterized protein LOC108630914 isoform X2 [Ceratina calcarata]|nr:uncharacterized protein LOC108630914 isoform X2 [Ceratina calcarata]XP_026674247.1 uncharacterized protein LOC108630914 isoform X2 [Ceratina calcarata]
MSKSMSMLAKLCILLLLYEYATCFIIPEELPTILSLIYSNIPPIKKGTDSRIGIGFRLGEHADFQVLLELGPQMETEPIGNADSKRRRDAMLVSAMKGELGPLAQAVAKYQIERKLQRELERLKKEEKLVSPVDNDDKKTAASDWLTKWSKDMVKSEDHLFLEDASSEKTAKTQIMQRIGKPPESNEEATISDLKKLYRPKDIRKSELP